MGRSVPCGREVVSRQLRQHHHLPRALYRSPSSLTQGKLGTPEDHEFQNTLENMVDLWLKYPPTPPNKSFLVSDSIPSSPLLVLCSTLSTSQHTVFSPLSFLHFFFQSPLLKPLYSSILPSSSPRSRSRLGHPRACTETQALPLS